MADRGCPTTLTKLGVGALAFTSTLAIYNSWGDDPASVLFVLAALLLLFLGIRELERGSGGGGRDNAKTKAAVWALTTLLTAMFAACKVALVLPLAVGVLVFLCLRDVEHQVHGGEGGVSVDGQYCALAKVGVAVLTCNSAVDVYDTRRDLGSAAFMLVSYLALVILIGLFLRAFARGHAGEQGQVAGCPY